MWQEFERDRGMTRNPGQSFWGPGWPILLYLFAVVAFCVWLEKRKPAVTSTIRFITG
jgi:hypothetical protein